MTCSQLQIARYCVSKPLILLVATAVARHPLPFFLEFAPTTCMPRSACLDHLDEHLYDNTRHRTLAPCNSPEDLRQTLAPKTCPQNLPQKLVPKTCLKNLPQKLDPKTCPSQWQPTVNDVRTPRSLTPQMEIPRLASAGAS